MTLAKEIENSLLYDLYIKLIERVEKLEKENEIRSDTIKCMDSTYDKAYREMGKELEKLETHLNNLHDLINIEDRITTSDVLCRLTKLEGHYYSDGDLSAIHGQINNMNKNDDFRDNEIKNIQEQSIKFEERLNKIEEIQKSMLTTPNIVWEKYHKTPYKCPVCDGDGSVKKEIDKKTVKIKWKIFFKQHLEQR